MTPIVDQKALDEFLERADVTQARICAAALDAMAAAAHLAALELETGDDQRLVGRHHRKQTHYYRKDVRQ